MAMLFSCHIALSLLKLGTGYTLLLEGSARTRVAETIRIALALARAGIPFQLRDAAHLAKMVQGQDWVGIVPSDYGSSYADQLFPPEDEVRDILAWT